MATTLAKSAAKVGIAVGAVMVTSSQGVWSANSEMGVKALNKVRSKVLPAANEMVEKIPSRESVMNTNITYWNSGVKTVFSAMSTAPEKSATFIKETLKDLKNSETSEGEEQIPSRESVMNTNITYWNSGVKTVFSAMSTAPEKSATFIKQTLKDLKK